MFFAETPVLEPLYEFLQWCSKAINAMLEWIQTNNR
jgi:hypothetical protein